MKALSLGFLAAALVAPGLARAEHDDFQPFFQLHVHDGSCGHLGTPAGRPSQMGRYELRTVQKWVDGYYEDVWVPERCETKHHRHRRHRHHLRCEGGYYDKRFVPGRYQAAQEWVWVPALPASGVEFRLSAAL